MPRHAIIPLTVLAAALAAGSAASEVLRSRVVFNSGVMQATGDQLADGIVLTYPIAFSGGDLDGCTAHITETLFDHAEEGWGIFRVKGEAICPNGGFRYDSVGAYDDQGLHGSGDVVARAAAPGASTACPRGLPNWAAAPPRRPGIRSTSASTS